MLIHCARPRHGISSEPKHFPIPTFIYIRRGVNIFIYMKAAQVNIILLMIQLLLFLYLGHSQPFLNHYYRTMACFDRKFTLVYTIIISLSIPERNLSVL